MRRHRRRAIGALLATFVLGVVTGCGESGSTSPGTVASSTTTTVAPTTVAPSTSESTTSTTEKSTTTTTMSVADMLSVWGGRTGFDEKLDAVGAAVQGLAGASDKGDIDGFSSACQDLHDASETLAGTLPSPLPELDAAVQSMADDWDQAMHHCIDGLAAQDVDMFNEVPGMVEQAMAHVAEIDAVIEEALGTGPSSSEGKAGLTELANSIGCTEVEFGAAVTGALATANCTFSGEKVMMSVYDGAPPPGSTVAYCANNEGKAVAMAIGPTWIIVAADSFEALLDVLQSEFKDEFTVTIMNC